MHENECYYRVGAIPQTQEVVRMTARLPQVLASVNQDTPKHAHGDDYYNPLIHVERRTAVL